MNKHTHTEWLREGNTVYALNLEGSNRFYLQVQGGWATQGRVRTDESELEANARLIAAAPDMLAGYEAIKHSIQQARMPGNDWRRELALIENTVNAAIAKATGESE